MNAPARLLTNDETAALLGIEPRALHRLRAKQSGDRGPVPTYVGRFPRYSRRSIEAYLEARAREASRGR